MVIVQDDRFDATSSITVCGLTTNQRQAPLFRLAVEPTDGNGLRSSPHLMVDKIMTIPRSKLGARIGRLNDDDMVRLNHAMMAFLGLTLPGQG